MHRLRSSWLVVVALLALPGLAAAASKVKIAALGDAAPGGGVFAGPSFTGAPSAAGNGWIAFRSLVAEGSTGEQIVVTNRVTGERKVAASLGQEVSKQVGRIKQFLGRPTVNASGAVAFAAVVTPPDDKDRGFFAPTPAGVFLFSGTALSVVAPPDLDTGFGILDLTTPINLFVDVSGIDIPERTPALNDAGDVAFVTATIDDRGRPAGGAVFVQRAGGGLTPVVKLNDAYDGGTFQILGPPALNNAGGLAFRGFVDGATTLDGVFSLVDGVPTLLVRDGIIPTRGPAGFPNDQTLSPGGFGDTLVLNDQGDVVFTVEPFFDGSDDASLDDIDGSPGVLLYHAGMTFLLGYPGQPILGRGRITSIRLSAVAGSAVAPPTLAPDGTVVFFASLNGGSSEMILRNAPLDPEPDTLVELGGSQPDATPAGGTYLAGTSAPAVDATGSLVFSARLAGATTAQAIIYQPFTGTPQAIVIGDAAPAPTQGFFGGPPFFQPHLNDRGDVVFKSFVARGPGLGIFRSRNGVLEPLVRLGDAIPLPGVQPILDLVGEPSLNEAGDIAFAALVPVTDPDTGNTTARRGIFSAGAAGLRPVVMPGDLLSPPDPSRQGAVFRKVAPNPALGDDGGVAFRANIEYLDPLGPVFLPTLKEDGLFLADASGIHLLAIAEPEIPDDPKGNSGTPDPFLRFRDPTVSSGRVAFRASLGRIVARRNGMFLADPSGVAPVAVEGDDLGGMTLTTLSGRAVQDASGAITFPGKIRRPERAEIGAILRRTGAAFSSLVETGQIGPNGGKLRSIGRPSVGSNGHVAFRASYESLTGGSPGFVLATPNGLSTYLRVGENAAASVGGRLLSVNQNAALNASDQLAFIGTIGGGSARSAIFLAAPAGLRVGALAIRRGPPPTDDAASLRPKDRIKVQSTLEPALGLPRPTTAPKEKLTRRAVSVAVADMKGSLIAVNVPIGSIEVRGRSLVLKPGAVERAQLKGLKVRVSRNGLMKIAFRTAPFDLSFAAGLRKLDDDGAVILEPPFTVRVDVGDEGGTAAVPCKATGRRVTCGG
ncbi:MAG TPA: choice-of-anchor tandem repeat NxxGxxAF-containing protein [Candidatus Binatia bacterium]|jgi:hypothetical protein|nr:choice-of-anchor tandem repeat NxxGxxAF-containing protein [Candidatus Binatia bacterium]